MGPDSGHAGDALALDGVLGTDAHENVLKTANIVDDSELGFEGAEIEDGIGDKLTGAVESNIAAAIDLVDFNTTRGESFTGRNDVGFMSVASESDDGRMLDEKQNVGNAFKLAQFNESFLKMESSGVVAASEIEDGNHAVY